jgi:hypothetical protein
MRAASSESAAHRENHEPHQYTCSNLSGSQAFRALKGVYLKHAHATITIFHLTFSLMKKDEKNQG